MENDIKYRLEKMGYSLHEIDRDIDVENLIIDILEDFRKTGNYRLLKAIPFIIYQSSPAEKKKTVEPKINLEKMRTLSEKKNVGLELNAVLHYTKEIFKKLHISEEWTKEIEKFLEEFSSERERESFLKNLNIRETDLREELKHEFLMQKRINELKHEGYLIDKIRLSEERDIKYHLSKIFSPKQCEIVRKIIDEKTLNKTEYEYYIRIIKKRLESITELRDLAETTMKKRPKKKLKRESE